jgi:hypothetical protein
MFSQFCILSISSIFSVVCSPFIYLIYMHFYSLYFPFSAYFLLPSIISTFSFPFLPHSIFYVLYIFSFPLFSVFTFLHILLFCLKLSVFFLGFQHSQYSPTFFSHLLRIIESLLILFSVLSPLCVITVFTSLPFLCFLHTHHFLCCLHISHFLQYFHSFYFLLNYFRFTYFIFLFSELPLVFLGSLSFLEN